MKLRDPFAPTPWDAPPRSPTKGQTFRERYPEALVEGEEWASEWLDHISSEVQQFADELTGRRGDRIPIVLVPVEVVADTYDLRDAVGEHRECNWAEGHVYRFAEYGAMTDCGCAGNFLVIWVDPDQYRKFAETNFAGYYHAGWARPTDVGNILGALEADKTIGELESEVLRLKSERSVAQSTIDELKADRDAGDELLLDEHSRIAELEQQLRSDQLRAQLEVDSQDQYIAKLETDAAANHESYVGACEEFVVRGDRIAELENRIEGQAQHIKGLQTIEDKNDRAIIELTDEIKRLRNQIAYFRSRAGRTAPQRSPGGGAA